AQTPPHPVPSRLLPGFGGDELPIGIARRQIARERPHVGDVGYLFRVAFDHAARLVTRDRDQLRYETNRDLRRLRAQLGTGNIGLVDGHEPGFDALAFALALPDRGLETLVYVARQQILERTPVPLGIGQHDHFVRRPRTSDEMLAVERLVLAGDGIKPGGHRRSSLGDSLPALRRLGAFGRLWRSLRGAAGQRYDVIVGRAAHRVARRIRIVRRPLPAR